MNLLDRVIGWVSPVAGIKRQYARAALKQVRAHEAASPRDPWKPRRAGASANADHEADAKALRDKARALIQNVPYIAAGMDSRVSMIVGTGIVPTFTGGQADKADALWKQWVLEAGADPQVRNLYALQALCVRAEDADGEVLIRKRYRRPTDGLTVPLQLQVLEVDWIDTTRTKGLGGNQVINGIEYDPIGRVVNYWLYSQHPGDSKKRAKQESRPVPASEIIHLFAPKRPGQNRGFPRLAPVIARTRDLQLIEDAELARKNLEQRAGVMYSGDPSQLVGAGVTPSDAAKTGDLGEIPSGAVFALPAGGHLEFVQPTAMPGHVESVRQHLKIICAAGGFTYESATGDLSEANFSSARVGQMNVRRDIEQLQWLHIVPDLCDQVVRAFLQAAELAGKISRIDEITVGHSTPKWEQVDPSKEVRAELEAIGGGLLSPSEALRRRGYDPKSAFDEMERDWKDLDARGLLPLILAMRKSGPLPPEAGANPAA
jgi:lambda family phage portal protein